MLCLFSLTCCNVRIGGCMHELVRGVFFWRRWCGCSAAPSHIETSQILQSVWKENCFETILPRQPVLEKRSFSWRLVALLFLFVTGILSVLLACVCVYFPRPGMPGVESPRLRCICNSSLVAGRTCRSDQPTVWPHFWNGVAGRQLGDDAVWWWRLHFRNLRKTNSSFGWKFSKALLEGCPLAAESLENSPKVTPSPSSNVGCCNAKIPSQPVQG